MARLNHSGSTIVLRRALFPLGFAGEVMFLVWETWGAFVLNEKVSTETPITALFRTALIEAYSAAGRDWFVTLEDPVTDPTYGTETGRNDIRFYPPFPSHREQTIFFTIECKRLHVRTKSGFKSLVADYVDDGVQRFVDEAYSAGLPCGGIVGYVMDNEVKKALASVLAELARKMTPLKIASTDDIRSPSAVLIHCDTAADTVHDRTDGPFTLHHLLVGVS